MMDLTMVLFERLGLLLVIAFVLTRIPGFRSLLYREFSFKMAGIHACVFGIFGIAGTLTGVVIGSDFTVTHAFVWEVEADQMVVSSSLVAIVMAGLLGGPAVGLGAGIIAGTHLFFLGGIGFMANSLVNPLTGLLAGFTARFFSQERVISPIKALFIGIFPPILLMHLLLIFDSLDRTMVELINTIGLPVVLSNSIAIAIFTAMIAIVLREQENEAAFATRQALTIAEEALPFLKEESFQKKAEGIADLFYARLKLAAVTVTNDKEVMAHKGLGGDHHRIGNPLITQISHQALESKEILVAYSQAEIQCTHKKCPLEAVIIIPIWEAQQTIGLIKLYFRKPQHIRPVELMLAEGLGQLIANQLKTIKAERLELHTRDAELSNLQAQINPHFLFNTLHMIAALFRKEPEKARHITVQLAHFMRFNLKLVSTQLVPLEKETEHVKAYIEIIQTRFTGRMQIHFIQPEEMSHLLIPPSSIQPLVENSVRHGLEHVSEGGRVDVKMEQVGKWIKISVQDNGQGFPDSILLQAGEKVLTGKPHGGTGLYNVNQRLINLLGEESRLHVRNLSGGGSEVHFTIPAVNTRKEDDL
ncbi:sensor protein LytS [Oceanobacillus oncorhynchi subsp. incaldanensis]|uniref:histidine kinase n=1 Tax=Oceanobacillus oncorhynchi TaxID=545501 RepID=A0A0A1MKY6_9BACI|nr:LytS/YhcK type 5TM receptor domain-containing protein [Oceanobacillus oncorhynchi]GIO20323.1 sensor protein LytS [Oceanobacillus oncorhynchi subsp. incaldanensis]CEI80534.1 Sensor histidine kinase YpdA [Oceanobacillus oncorhynchi]